MIRRAYRLCSLIFFLSAVVAAWGQAAPTATLTATCTAPCNAPATITLSATTTVASGRAVSKVEFYDGATLLATDTASPYSSTRTAVVGGSHSFTAKVYDNAATPLTGVSAAKGIAVNTAPSVTLVAACGANPCAAPASVTLTATPTDPDGSIAKIEFYRGATLISTKVAVPWTFTDPALTAATYSYTAKAFDNAATPLATTSTAQSVTVATAPTVTLTAACTAPCNAPAAITLTATATVASGRAVSKVEFYEGATLLATDTTSPYSSARAAVTGGSHIYTAKVYDTAATPLTATSTAIAVAVNTAPTVSLAAVCNANPCNAPATVTLTATPADVDGTISKVEFYRGATLLATKIAAPWTYSDAALAAGSYSYTAKAFDSATTALATTSTAQAITVVTPVTPPTVTLTAACTAPCNAPATVTLTATTTVASGRTVSKVEFYEGATLLATDTTAPYTSARTSVTGGARTYTAKAYDSGATPLTATSTAIAVAVNTAPTVSLTATCNVSPCSAPATVTLTATPADSDGTISKVEFYRGSTLVATTTAAPWTFSDAARPAGTFSYTAKAFDNGAVSLSTTSTAQSVVVSVSTAASVTLTATCPNMPCMVPISVDLIAVPTVASGRAVARVEYYDGAQLLGETTVAPHAAGFVIYTAGSHSFTAKVYDNATPPTVAFSAAQVVNYASMDLTATCAAPCDKGATITLTVGNIMVPGKAISRVEFFDQVNVHGADGAFTSVGATTTAPWTISIPNAAWGEHLPVATAYDSGGTPALVASARTALIVGEPVTLALTCIAPCVEPATINFSVDARYSEAFYLKRVAVLDGPTVVGDTDWLGFSNGGLPLWNRILPYVGTVTGIRSGNHTFSAFVDAARYYSVGTYRIGTATQALSVTALPSQTATLTPDGAASTLSVPAGSDVLYKISAQSGDHLSLLLENNLPDDGATQVSYSLGTEYCSTISPQLPPETGNLSSHGNLLAYGPLRNAHCYANLSQMFNAPNRQVLNLSAFGPTDMTIRLSRPTAAAAQSIAATLTRQEQLTLTPNVAPVAVAPLQAGRAQRYQFALVAKQIVSFVQTQSGPSGYGVDMAIVPPSTPDGFLNANWPLGATFPLVLRATETGNHTMVATQQSAVRGSATLAMNTATPVGTLATDGTVLQWQPSRKGAIGTISLPAVAGRTYTLSAISPINTQDFRIFIDDPSGAALSLPYSALFRSVEFVAVQSGVHTITVIATAANPYAHDFTVLDGLPTVSFANLSAVAACPGGPYSNSVVVSPSGYVDYVYVDQVRVSVGGSPQGIVSIPGAGPYAFAWTNYLLGESYQLVATAVLKNGIRVTSAPVAVTFSAPPAVIDCALAGGNLAMDDDQFSFVGDVTGAKNASIFVNNVRVPIDEQGRFFANNIPLTQGNNSISVLINQLSGHTTLTYNVTRSGSPAFSVALGKDTGNAPFATTVTVTNRNNSPWQRINIDQDGNGTDDVVLTALAGSTASAQLSLPAKGRFRVRVRVFGANDSLLFETFRYVLVTLPTDDIAVVTEVYEGMTEMLRVGSVVGALNHFTDESLPKFRIVLNALAPSLPLIAGNYGLIGRNLGSCCSVILYSSTAELLVTRYKGGRYYGYRIYLVRDAADGLWRIHDM